LAIPFLLFLLKYTLGLDKSDGACDLEACGLIAISPLGAAGDPLPSFCPDNVCDSDDGFTDLSFICDISLVAAKPRWPGPGEFDPLDPAAITEVGARCEVTLDEAETKPIFILFATINDSDAV
jgi:hypothetical protein